MDFFNYQRPIDPVRVESTFIKTLKEHNLILPQDRQDSLFSSLRNWSDGSVDLVCPFPLVCSLAAAHNHAKRIHKSLGGKTKTTLGKVQQVFAAFYNFQKWDFFTEAVRKHEEGGEFRFHYHSSFVDMSNYDIPHLLEQDLLVFKSLESFAHVEKILPAGSLWYLIDKDGNYAKMSPDLENLYSKGLDTEGSIFWALDQYQTLINEFGTKVFTFTDECYSKYTATISICPPTTDHLGIFLGPQCTIHRNSELVNLDEFLLQDFLTTKNTLLGSKFEKRHKLIVELYSRASDAPKSKGKNIFLQKVMDMGRSGIEPARQIAATRRAFREMFSPDRDGWWELLRMLQYSLRECSPKTNGTDHWLSQQECIDLRRALRPESGNHLVFCDGAPQRLNQILYPSWGRSNVRAEIRDIVATMVKEKQYCDCGFLTALQNRLSYMESLPKLGQVVPKGKFTVSIDPNPVSGSPVWLRETDIKGSDAQEMAAAIRSAGLKYWAITKTRAPHNYDDLERVIIAPEISLHEAEGVKIVGSQLWQLEELKKLPSSLSVSLGSQQFKIKVDVSRFASLGTINFIFSRKDKRGENCLGLYDRSYRNFKRDYSRECADYLKTRKEGDPDTLLDAIHQQTDAYILKAETITGRKAQDPFGFSDFIASMWPDPDPPEQIFDEESFPNIENWVEPNGNHPAGFLPSSTSKTIVNYFGCAFAAIPVDRSAPQELRKNALKTKLTALKIPGTKDLDRSVECTGEYLFNEKGKDLIWMQEFDGGVITSILFHEIGHLLDFSINGRDINRIWYSLNNMTSVFLGRVRDDLHEASAWVLGLYAASVIDHLVDSSFTMVDALFDYLGHEVREFYDEKKRPIIVKVYEYMCDHRESICSFGTAFDKDTVSKVKGYFVSTFIGDLAKNPFWIRVPIPARESYIYSA